MFEHFLQAQQPVYARVTAELAAGRKQGHWMWFIFPQLRALGRSPMAYRYGIADLGEAEAYAGEPVLGERLRECVQLVIDTEQRTVHEIFGNPDDLKFCSSLTLFGRATGEPLFADALTKFYAGEEDRLTLRVLDGA
jgi:uncharacterized protein (DUF1810 family)